MILIFSYFFFSGTLVDKLDNCIIHHTLLFVTAHQLINWIIAQFNIHWFFFDTRINKLYTLEIANELVL